MSRAERTKQRREDWPEVAKRLAHVDEGIAEEVLCLAANGVETCQSCQGGPGHCYPEPTVEFFGDASAGWTALGVALTYGLRVRELRRVWDIDCTTSAPDRPVWVMTFRPDDGYRFDAPTVTNNGRVVSFEGDVLSPMFPGQALDFAKAIIANAEECEAGATKETA